MELTACLQNCKFYRTIIPNYSIEERKKLNKELLKSEDFSAHGLRRENVIL